MTLMGFIHHLTAHVKGETMATATAIPQMHVQLLSLPQEGDSHALQVSRDALKK